MIGLGQHIRDEGFGLACDWCGDNDGTIVIEGTTTKVFRLCIGCAVDVLKLLKEEVKVQRLRYLIDTGKGIVLDEEDEGDSETENRNSNY